jgi:hypothetical protein
MVRVNPGGSSGSQPDQGTFFRVGKEALLDSFGFSEACVAVGRTQVDAGLGGWPIIEHFEITSDSRLACEPGARLEEKPWKELRFSASLRRSLAMTPQCSRPKSTGNARRLICG